jgi:hypothetical protein
MDGRTVSSDKKVSKARNTIVYKIKDWNGDDVEGTLYKAELQPVHVDENTVYTIDTIIKKECVVVERKY